MGDDKENESVEEIIARLSRGKDGYAWDDCLSRARKEEYPQEITVYRFFDGSVLVENADTATWHTLSEAIEEGMVPKYSCEGEAK